MQSAPAAIVSRMDSGVGPPVAMIGTFGKSLRMVLTTSGVSSAAETFRIDVPASRRFYMSVALFTTVAITGISTV